MKKGLHIAAIALALVNLLYVVVVAVFWLYNGVADMADMLLFGLPTDIAFIIVSALFLVAVCKAKVNALVYIYWSAIIAELLVLLLIGGKAVLGFFGVLALCAAVILVMTLLRNRLNFRVMCIIISLAMLITTAVELWFVIAYAPLGLIITVTLPWYLAAPLLPALATIFITAVQKAE